MDFDAEILEAAQKDKNLGLLHGKMGACVYFYTISNHDEASEAYQIARQLLTQVVQQLPSVKSIELDKGLIGLALGLSYLMQNKYVQDSSGQWLDSIDAYIYKVAVKTMDVDLGGKEMLSLIDILIYETVRLERLKNGYGKELCLRLIKDLVNNIYMRRPACFYSEPIPFKVHSPLLSFLLALLKVRELGVCTERIDRIFNEMEPFLFGLQPVLQPNRFCLALVSSLIAQATRDEGWSRYSERLMVSIDFPNLYSTDLYDMSLLLDNGILGMTLLADWYNEKSSKPISIDMDSFASRMEKSCFWKRFAQDEVFRGKHYSLDGYCGIKLYLNFLGGL